MTRSGRQRGGAQVQALLGDFAEEQIGSAQEPSHKARGGVPVEILRAADLQEPAHLHDADAISQRKGFLLIVRHQNRGHADASLDRAHGLAQFDSDLGVQCAEGLIEQQHRRFVGERPGDGHALLLSTGQLARIAVIVAFERHQLQQLLAAPAALGRAHAPHAQRKLNVVRDRHVAEQGVVLEHQADAALARGQAR